MSGMAPMAFCRALTSSEGPVSRDVPVSTMASQPLLHRLSWLPTDILIHTQNMIICLKMTIFRKAWEYTPIHMDLPVGLTGHVDVVKVAGVIFRVGTSQKQLTARLSVWVPEDETGRLFQYGPLKKKPSNFALKFQ